MNVQNTPTTILFYISRHLLKIINNCFVCLVLIFVCFSIWANIQIIRIIRLVAADHQEKQTVSPEDSAPAVIF